VQGTRFDVHQIEAPDAEDPHNALIYVITHRGIKVTIAAAQPKRATQTTTGG